MTERRCGLIGIVGRPNVGKSTLLNRLLGRKISITSSRAQTTRHRIVGIKTTANSQFVYVDTPGLHRNAKRHLNRRMNKAAINAINDVDVLVWVLEAGRWRDEDQWILEEIRGAGCAVVVAINKIDRLADKTRLLPQIQDLMDKLGDHPVVPIAAIGGQQLPALEREIEKRLPPAEYFFYPEDMHTDRSPQFMAAERVREKLTRHLGEELPYAISVEIESFKETDRSMEIHVLIWVERDSQKAIVIGKQGEQLKTMATQARLDMEDYFGKKVILKCWVKCKSGWMDDERQLKLWGYDE